MIPEEKMVVGILLLVTQRQRCQCLATSSESHWEEGGISGLPSGAGCWVADHLRHSFLPPKKAHGEPSLSSGRISQVKIITSNLGNKR